MPPFEHAWQASRSVGTRPARVPAPHDPLLLRGSFAVHHSFRNATSGSTRIARSAGIAHASMAVASRTPATAAYVAGSVGLTSKSCEARYRPAPNAVATPMVSPAAINPPA